MQALEMSLFDFLRNAKKIITPHFHRTFYFDIDNAKDLYCKILQGEILGIFTLQKSSENEYIIIDGYQRLMLFSLLMCAISGNNIDYDDFVRSLKTDECQNLKIEFLGKDEEFYKAVSTNFFGKLTSCSKNLSEIYNFFLQKTALSKRKTHSLLKKIFSVNAIFFICEENEISSNLLYEEMNKQNQSLDEFDEIKNIASMFCSNNQNIFNTYFLAFENDYNNAGCKNLIIPFIRDYLTIQNNGIIPQKGKLVANFKSFLQKIVKIRDVKLVFADFYRYSKYYLQIVNASVKDEQIKSEIEQINLQEAIDAYPYLMEVFEDWDKNNISKDMMIDILKMINIFVEQRNLPNASAFVMTFAKLSTHINKMLALKDYTPKIYEEIPLTINKICNN